MRCFILAHAGSLLFVVVCGSFPPQLQQHLSASMADAHPKDIYKDTHADRNKIKLLFCGGASAVIARTMIAPLSRTTVLFQVSEIRLD